MLRILPVIMVFGCLFISCDESEQIEMVVEDAQIEQSTTSEDPRIFESAEEMKTAIEIGESEYDFYANFTEPFFTIYLMDKQALIVKMDADDQLVDLLTTFNENAVEQEILVGDKTMKIIKSPGSDGMSSINYPYYVEYDSFVGGGSIEQLVEV